MLQNNNRSKFIHFYTLVSLLAISISACASTGAAITDITWQWISLVETEPASQSVVPNPENYTLVLAADGTLSIKADCNMVGGSYTLEGSALTIQLGPSTMAFCGEESLDYLFTNTIATVESFSVEEGQLVVQLANAGGSMTFQETE